MPTPVPLDINQQHDSAPVIDDGISERIQRRQDATSTLRLTGILPRAPSPTTGLTLPQ